MTSRWLVTPFYFEHPELALFSAAPDGAATNAPEGIADRSPGSMARLHRPIAGFVAKTLRAGARPVSLAGDCCAAVPVLAALLAAGVEPALLWIDGLREQIYIERKGVYAEAERLRNQTARE